MTLIIQKPTGAKLVFRKELPADAEADAYIAAVEAADGQALESGVKFAIKNFVLCCKQDGIWDAIKASCILAGARTLDGALVPLVGAAPTNAGGLFVSDDYNRKTGLVGDGSTKYLDSNRANNADPQNSKHTAIYQTSLDTNVSKIYIGASGSDSYMGRGPTGGPYGRLNNAGGSAWTLASTLHVLGFIGQSRSDSTSILVRTDSTDSILLRSSNSNVSNSTLIFALPGPSLVSSARFAFYSIGESLDLALLDARVTDLINAFAAAIP
jgi:hypothetical protein